MLSENLTIQMLEPYIGNGFSFSLEILAFSKVMISTCKQGKKQPFSLIFYKNPSQNITRVRYLNPSNAETISSKAQECKILEKPLKPCRLGIHLRALAEYSQMSTHLPGFQYFFFFLHLFVLAKLATSSMRVNLPSPFYYTSRILTLS